MAEQAVDRVAGKGGPKCKTLNIKLFGHEGCKCFNCASRIAGNAS